MNSAAPQPDRLIGTTLGQFEILDEVGRGGMATVYRARQKSINRVVAIKVLPRILMHDPTFIERFAREVDVVAHLEHPHILPIYDYGEANGIPYIAMRYLAGGTMASVIRRGAMSVRGLVSPMIQIAQALDHAHRQGVVHRDLKPGNILLDEVGNAYLSDFGIAKVINSSLTGSAIIGTPAYMSPEQANGLAVDGRSDVYSLGIVLFELLTGREPFQAETPIAMLLKQINEPMPALAAFRPGLPDELNGVIAKATAKRAADRYESALEMAAAFQQAADHAPDETDQITLAPGAPASPRITPPRITPTRSTSTDARPTPPAPAVSTPHPAVRDNTPTMRTEAIIKPPSAPPTQTGESTRLMRRRPPWVPLVMLLAALVGVGFVGLVAVGVLEVGQPLRVLPTPFPGADRIEGAGFQINVPGDWTFLALSQGDQVTHVWQNGDRAYVSVTLIDADVSTDPAFRAAVDAYEAEFIRPQSDLLFLEEAPAPDGSLRRSYRLSRGGSNTIFLPGQTDLFYLRRAGQMVVVDVFTADETGNTLVPIMQWVLDSVRVG